MSEHFPATREVFHAMVGDYQRVREEEGRLRAARMALGLAATSAVVVPYLTGGLEATIGTLGANVYAETHSRVAVGAANGLASLAIETGLSFAVAGCMRSFPGAAQALERRKYEGKSFEQKEQPPAEGTLEKVRTRVNSAASTFVISVAAGSPGIMLRAFVKSPEEGIVAHRRRGLKTAAVWGGLQTQCLAWVMARS